MKQDIELLNVISQNSERGKDGVSHLLKISNNTNFNTVLERRLKEYENIYNTASNLCRKDGNEPASVNPIAKMTSYVTTQIKSMADHSISNMAEMLIQESTTAVTDITKQVNDYCGSNQKILGLAKQLLSTEQTNIEEMKKFL